MEIFFNVAMMLLKYFYLFIYMASFKLYFCDRKMANGIESVLGRKYVVYFVKSPYSKVDYDAWLCGGALITAQQILTSAACLVEMEKIYAIAGYKKYVNGDNIENDACTKFRKQKVVKYYTTKDYTISSSSPEVWLKRDIGVAMVEKPYNFSDMSYHIYCSYAPQPIQLNYETKYEAAGSECIFYGWGPIKARHPNDPQVEDTNSQFLQQGATLVLNRDECMKSQSNTYLKDLLNNYVICTSLGGHVEGPPPIDNSPSNRERDECILRRYSLNPDINNNTCLDEDFDFRRRDENINTTIQLRLKRRRTKRETAKLCQNDHGGPLIRWIGTKEVLIGVAINGFYDENYECRGPYLFTSTAQTAHIIKCMMETDEQLRKSCNDHMQQDSDKIKEIVVRWPEETVLRAQSDSFQKISSFLRQGNEESPLHMRPTKDVSEDELEDIQPYDRRENQGDEQVFELQNDQKNSQPNSNAMDPPQGQSNDQRNQQVKEQPQPYEDVYEQMYEQPRQDTTTLRNSQPQEGSYSNPQAKPVDNEHMESIKEQSPDSYNSPQLDPYNAPQMDSYNSPQMDPYNSPQLDSYNSPQIDSYKQPQIDTYQQPQVDSYKQPQIDTYQQPQVDSYKQPQIDSYQQPQVDTYKQNQMDPYKKPQEDYDKQNQMDPFKLPLIESYNQPQSESYNQPQIVAFNQPQIGSYNQPQVDVYKDITVGSTVDNNPKIPSYNQPQIDPLKFPNGDSESPKQIQPYLHPQIEPVKKPQEDIYSQSHSDTQIPPLKAPSAETYKPDIFEESFKPSQFQPESFKLPIVERYRPSKVDPYNQQAFDSYMIPTEELTKSALNNDDQKLLPQSNQSPGQPSPPPQSSPVKTQENIQPADVLREGPEPIILPTFDLTRDDPQSFEQMYSQLHVPAAEMPSTPAPEQTFEELYKSLHDPPPDQPHDQYFEVPHEQPKEQRFEQPIEEPIEQMDQQFEQLPKQTFEQPRNIPQNEPEPVEVQPPDQTINIGGQDEVKVRPQMPLDYQTDDLPYSVRRNFSV